MGGSGELRGFPAGDVASYGSPGGRVGHRLGTVAGKVNMLTPTTFTTRLPQVSIPP